MHQILSSTVTSRVPVRLAVRRRRGRGAARPSCQRRTFTLLVIVSTFVGAMVGLGSTFSRAGRVEFHLVARSAISRSSWCSGSRNSDQLRGGRLSDRLGRKGFSSPAGWWRSRAVSPDVGPDLDVVLVANVLLGVSQGLTWSTTVIMKIDLVGAGARSAWD
jgi:hypothetical protein